MVFGVIVAAGKGRRMQQPISKPYIELKGKPILAYTLEVFCKSPIITEVILVLEASYMEYCRNRIIKRYKFDKPIRLVEGDRLRQDSVYRGLKAIPDVNSIVVIHDGVRPFVKLHQINEVVDAAKQFGSAVLAVPVIDTIKRVRNYTVVETLQRSELWCTQTPGAFDCKLIKEAYERAYMKKIFVDDDATLVELLTDKKTKIVPGSYENIKITTPIDIEISLSILKTWQF